jgi:hypothetical protein
VAWKMRFMSTAVAISTLSLTCAYTLASSVHDDPTALAALQVKADQVQPRDQCFLYAKLVSQMTELAGQQFHSGDSGRASEPSNGCNSMQRRSTCALPTTARS